RTAIHTAQDTLQKNVDAINLLMPRLAAEVKRGPSAVIPTGKGSAPSVDVSWKLLPDEIIKDIFGEIVSRENYCYEIVVRNNSESRIVMRITGFNSDAGLISPVEPAFI